MTDGVEKWEKIGVYESKSSEPEAGQKSRYEAFGVANNCARLWLKRAGAGDCAYRYEHLAEMSMDSFGLVINLYFALPGPRWVRVQVRGENLAPLIAALVNGTAAWIQLFNDKRFHLPEDDSTPFVRELLFDPDEKDVPPPMQQRN